MQQADRNGTKGTTYDRNVGEWPAWTGVEAERVPGVESITYAGLGAVLVALVSLFVRSLVSGSAATAARYEAELQRLQADRDYWRELYIQQRDRARNGAPS